MCHGGRNKNAAHKFAVFLENVMYNYAASMDSYSDSSTLQIRVMELTRANIDILFSLIRKGD